MNRARHPLRSPFPRRDQRGFTLIEIMLVVALIGIIMAVAIPSYKQHVIKGRRGEAQTALSQVAQAQERWRSNNTAYATMSDLFPSGLAGLKHYVVDVNALAGSTDLVAGYEVHARPRDDSPQASDTQCPDIFIRVTGGQLYYRDGTMTANAITSNCWPQ